MGRVSGIDSSPHLQHPNIWTFTSWWFRQVAWSQANRSRPARKNGHCTWKAEAVPTLPGVDSGNPRHQTGVMPIELPFKVLNFWITTFDCDWSNQFVWSIANPPACLWITQSLRQYLARSWYRHTLPEFFIVWAQWVPPTTESVVTLVFLGLHAQPIKLSEDIPVGNNVPTERNAWNDDENYRSNSYLEHEAMYRPDCALHSGSGIFMLKKPDSWMHLAREGLLWHVADGFAGCDSWVYVPRILTFIVGKPIVFTFGYFHLMRVHHHEI